MASWQTSLIGILALLIGSGLLFVGKITWDQFILFVGLGGLGLAAKDRQVTGGNTPQASPPGVALKSDAMGVIKAVEVMQGQGNIDLPLETAKSAAEAVVAKPAEVAIVEAVCNTAPCQTGK